MKGTRHNGRSGKNGVYNPLHNDRRFNPEHSEHIDNERVRQNIYWDCYQGYTTMEDQGKENNFSFEQIELAFYEEHYGNYVMKQNERHVKARHPDRCKEVEDVWKNKKTCPEESIYQLGTIDEHASVETLILVFDEFKKEFDKRFGSNVHIIDWSLHMDEATPHIHERHVFDATNRYGEIEPKQETALELKKMWDEASVMRYLKVFDHIKQYSIQKEIESLPGRIEHRRKYQAQVVFLPYLPDLELVKDFEYVRDKQELVWDFFRRASEKLKKQVFLLLNYILDNLYRDDPKERRVRYLLPLHWLYDFCVEEEIDDLEGLELEQIQRFEKIVEQKVVNVKNSMQIIDNSRKILFLTAPEIHWHANVWYMERFHLLEDRLNPSNPVQRLSFIEVTNKKNRELLQEYAKYHVGIGGLTIANIRGQLYEVKRLLEYFKEEESICQVDENQLDDYFRKLEEKDTKDDTFNKRIVHYIKFYQFLNVRGYMKEIPFKPEYYLKKTYPEHHDRTVEEKVYMEILHKLYAFPLVPRLIFLHLWCTGLRISEVCTLKGDAYYWDGEDAWLKVYQIKMKADKMIPIPFVMYRIMRKYIEREHIRPKDYIFKGKDGGAYRGTTFRQEFQQYCDKNGIADGSYIFKTHDYRHTLATQFYDEDVSIQTIRDYLGHFSEEMTKQYVDFMPKRIEKASDTYFKKPENDLASTIKAKKRGERK